VENKNTYSASSSQSSSGTAVSSFVGATKEDLKEMGVRVEKVKGGKSLLQLARENGGVMQKHEYLNAREGG